MLGNLTWCTLYVQSYTQYEIMKDESAYGISRLLVLIYAKNIGCQFQHNPNAIVISWGQRNSRNTLILVNDSDAILNCILW